MIDKIEITGQIEAIEPLQEFASGFKKRVFVINTGGQYPQLIPCELLKDNVAHLEGAGIGDDVTAMCRLQGREYNGKYYVSVVCWKIEIKANYRQPETSADGGDDSPF